MAQYLIMVVVIALFLWALCRERRRRLLRIGALLLEELLDGKAGGVRGDELRLPLLVICRAPTRVSFPIVEALAQSLS